MGDISTAVSRRAFLRSVAAVGGATGLAALAAACTKDDVEAALIWEPTVTLLTQSGAGTIVATQQQLWEQRLVRARPRST